MRWGIVILIILGVVAAACAALLVNAMGTDSSASAKNLASVEVMVAKKSLPAMTVVTLDHVVKQMVSKNDLPQGQLSSPARVIGRVLSIPVVEGQVLTESCFVTEGTGAQLAAALPNGMRAFTVNLTSRAIPDELLLYPGCVVDVLFSAKLSSSDRRGQAVSATILQGIQVLAVQGDSVVSTPESEQAATAAKTRRANSGLQVTLLVDQKQAEALQVAADNGNISLSVRNPLDKGLSEMEGTVLNQGQLANLSSLLMPEVLAAAQKDKQRGQDWLASQLVGPGDVRDPNGQAEGVSSGTAVLLQQPRTGEEYQPRKAPRWGVTVIRGKEAKTEEFAIAGSESSGADAEK